MLKLYQIWLVEASSSWLLCPVGWLHHSNLGCFIFLALALETTISSKSWDCCWWKWYIEAKILTLLCAGGQEPGPQALHLQ